MARAIEFPKTCSLVENGNTSLLIKNEFKETLLKQGITHPKQLIANTPQTKHFEGRSFLPSILIQESDGKRMVVKHCMRGGLLGFLNNDIFWGDSRSFYEMHINAKILEKGMKTTEIIAAVKEKIFGPLYRAYIFSMELPECSDLINYFNGLKAKTLAQRFKDKKHLFQSIAKAFAKMHSEGIYHNDLHLKNILIRQINDKTPDIYIIDFDKADIKEKLSPKEKAKNLLRFNRSIEKYKLKGGPITRTDQMRFFKEYFKIDTEVFNLFNKNKTIYLLPLKLRILKWRLLNFTSQTFKK
ncbi:MAG: phosphotransferase [Deltaproteobacteria bacterium]|nr:phosphotransferase [Deltaproteobacteria bacterium]